MEGNKAEANKQRNNIMTDTWDKYKESISTGEQDREGLAWEGLLWIRLRGGPSEKVTI